MAPIPAEMGVLTELTGEGENKGIIETARALRKLWDWPGQGRVLVHSQRDSFYEDVCFSQYALEFSTRGQTTFVVGNSTDPLDFAGLFPAKAEALQNYESLMARIFPVTALKVGLMTDGETLYGLKLKILDKQINVSVEGITEPGTDFTLALRTAVGGLLATDSRLLPQAMERGLFVDMQETRGRQVLMLPGRKDSRSPVVFSVFDCPKIQGEIQQVMGRYLTKLTNPPVYCGIKVS